MANIFKSTTSGSDSLASLGNHLFVNFGTVSRISFHREGKSLFMYDKFDR